MGQVSSLGLGKPLVLATVRKYEDYILGDASNELGIRNSHTNEYFYYDCAGILWLCPTDAGKVWCELLEDRQFQLEYRPLISNVFHWSRRAKEAEKLRDGFILDLRLEAGEKAYE